MNKVNIAWTAPARPLFRGVRRRRGVCIMLAEQAEIKEESLSFMLASASVAHTPSLSRHPSQEGTRRSATFAYHITSHWSSASCGSRPLLRGVRRRRGVCILPAERTRIRKVLFMLASASVTHTPSLKAIELFWQKCIPLLGSSPRSLAKASQELSFSLSRGDAQ